MSALEESVLVSGSDQKRWPLACAAALAELPGMGPKRLSGALADQGPDLAWRALCNDSAFGPSLVSACGSLQLKLKRLWHRMACDIDPWETLDRYDELGIGVWTTYGDYPAVLRDDFEAPTVLFWQGDSTALLQPRVALVGTRRCSWDGRATAERIGYELSEAGVSVVSGLALGIDAAAHKGALGAVAGAPPIAVVGNGLDSVYPVRNKALWAQLQERGLIVSEAPLGAAPEAWRFPARNRIIAAISDLVVVVESHEKGGSLNTVSHALDRGIEVMAVPGSPNSPSSRGSNALLQEGAHPVCTGEDVLAAESLKRAGEYVPLGAGQIRVPGLEPPDPQDIDVLGAIGWDLTSTEEVLVRTGLDLSTAAMSLLRLESRGYIAGDAGWWQRIESVVGE